MAMTANPMAGMPPGAALAEPEFKGMGVLNQFIEPTSLECLNEHKGRPVANAFDGASETYLQSDPETDNQLLISVGFRDPVKISAINLKVPAGAEDSRPSKIKIFLGRDNSLDFDEAESRIATQEFEEVVLGQEMPVKFVKFQNVSNITIFVPGSAKGDTDDTDIPTKISLLQFIGCPAAKCDMKDFKAIKG
jgi:hypothetical protein